MVLEVCVRKNKRHFCVSKNKRKRNFFQNLLVAQVDNIDKDDGCSFIKNKMLKMLFKNLLFLL